MPALLNPSLIKWLFLGCLCLVQSMVTGSPPASIEFFESQIRPVLVEHCYPCHASDTERLGGLLLDSKAGWQTGGDTGPAIMPGNALASRLFRVISSTDEELEMPPDGKLPQAIINDLRDWINAGAHDPRSDVPTPKPSHSKTIDWEQARTHWAYQPVREPAIPESNATDSIGQWPQSPIDQFILSRLRSHGLTPNEPASRHTLLRRLSLDLTGLPPTADMISDFASASDESLAYEQIVNQLIASHDFAERFARHWLDVARYAESVTLRGLVQSEAWRYRDYVIDALHRDRSWKEVIREQIAGDLLDRETVKAKQDAQIAVTFLCMGNSNLENQQKRELEMDFIDEQLDTLGRALLGQTLGCARCHDHKFDPIPTSDYYAMAGILHSSIGIDHANVSRWVEIPLPLEAFEQAHWASIESELQETKNELQKLSVRLGQSKPASPKSIDSSRVDGIVVDDRDARRVGQWQESVHTAPYVDQGYLHDMSAGQGEKSLTFEPIDLPPGLYELRIAYCAGENRSSRTAVTVFSADGESTTMVNQKVVAAINGLWQPLGTYRFESGGQKFVMVSNEVADGHVIGDAIQFIPVDRKIANTTDNDKGSKPRADLAKSTKIKSKQANVVALDNHSAVEVAELVAEQKQRLARQNELQKQLNLRPKSMGFRPRPDAGDLPVHIRGSIHNLGPTVPRGFMQILDNQIDVLVTPETAYGRLELADWIANDNNALTARVFVNRVWLWVMGQGLVRTPDNFGTTGQLPSHPDLLDWLTVQFIQDGWSVKRLVKRIVMSSTYRQTSRLPQADDSRLMVDPDNHLWWRSDRKPVSAEALRDSVLAISGELDRTPYGSRIRNGINADYGYQHDELIRSVYMPVFRNAIPEVLETFNYTDTSFVTGQRQRGVIAQQALAILNHPWFASRAHAAAQRNWQELNGGTQERVVLAFTQTVGRNPQPSELEAAVRFFDDCYLNAISVNPTEPQEQRHLLAQQRALAQVYHGLFATAEFRRTD